MSDTAWGSCGTGRPVDVNDRPASRERRQALKRWGHDPNGIPVAEARTAVSADILANQNWYSTINVRNGNGMGGQTRSQPTGVRHRSSITARPGRLGSVDRGMGRSMGVPVRAGCFERVRSGKTGRRDASKEKD